MPDQFRGLHYRLRCVGCGQIFHDNDGMMPLGCDAAHPPALLRTEYREQRFRPEQSQPGLFRYADWLPIRLHRSQAQGPIVFRADRLAESLGLRNLIAVFSGFWPERGAFMETCSFKELEAEAVTARSPIAADRTLVVASAGNTARAFLHVCSLHKTPALIVVPETALPKLWHTRPLNPCVKLLALGGNADYADAIAVAGRIAELPGFFAEGGAANVARRDGMGTVLLAAAEHIGQLPTHYFQAVGSGTGAIAAFEAAGRLLRAEEQFDSAPMRLHLAQNIPFTPMTNAWKRRSRTLDLGNERIAKEQISRINADVLSNRTPPYALSGGLYDVLTDSDGSMYGVTNEEAEDAAQVFERTEGCDLDPAAAVALAALRQAVSEGQVASQQIVVLNLTGGGRVKAEREFKIRSAVPDLLVSRSDSSSICDKIESLSGCYAA